MKLFNSISIRKPKLNKFDLSHEKKMSLNPGDLVPILIQDVVPGDKFRVNSEIMMRLAPMLAPIMHRVNVYTHYFFVPNRLVWSNWEKFITGGEDGLQTAVFPNFNVTDANKAQFVKGSLADYMGVPATPANVAVDLLDINALPFRAYQMIYNEYYRDQNLTAKIDFATGDAIDAADLAKLTVLRKRAWEKDYFTSALPWTQRGGDVGVNIDLNLEYLDTSLVKTTAGALAAASSNIEVDGVNPGDLASATDLTTARIENIDQANSTGDMLINSLRTAVRLQEWLERNARAGSRYIEQILSHFGVISSDARLQRPEYLGGGKTPVVISEVLTHADTATAGAGEMFGHGISVGNTNQFSKFFEEHGYVIGIMSVVPRTAYQQGVEKHLLKSDKFDFFFPEFANLGEQEVIKQELYIDYTNVSAGLFGYQSRYAEYKYKQSTVHGDFKDNLTFWHMGRIFSAVPSLNTSFIEIEDEAWSKAFVNTDPSDHHLYAYIYNKVDALRPMPYLGIPSL